MSSYDNLAVFCQGLNINEYLRFVTPQKGFGSKIHFPDRERGLPHINLKQLISRHPLLIFEFLLIYRQMHISSCCVVQRFSFAYLMSSASRNSEKFRFQETIPTIYTRSVLCGTRACHCFDKLSNFSFLTRIPSRINVC